jgi:hypothetical protein
LRALLTVCLLVAVCCKQLQQQEAALQVQVAHLTLQNMELRRELGSGWSAAEPSVMQVSVRAGVQNSDTSACCLVELLSTNLPAAEAHAYDAADKANSSKHYECNQTIARAWCGCTCISWRTTPQAATAENQGKTFPA